MSASEVRVLGPVELVGDDGPVPLPAKHRRLLAALVVADGSSCTVDELVDAVWGEAPPPSARKLLQIYVSQLRRALPDGMAIATRGGSYALELPAGSLDGERFERLVDEAAAARREGNPALARSLAQQALGLWRGRPYGELAYEEVARAESERLEELQLAALEERLDAELALGRHGEVLGEVLALADGQPLRERLQELAMLALYRCGRQSEALERYARVRAHLRDELGLEPGPALRELQVRILRHDEALESSARPVATTALPVPPSPLVGRARELAQLAALLERRDERLIVLTGAGGSGKTRLAFAAARDAAATFANGAAIVELAPLHDPTLVLPTIAHALGVTDAPPDELLDAVATAVRERELLLVADNVEQVREAAPTFVDLLARAPRLTLLVTSRAVLHVSGERVFPVAPLPIDDAVTLFEQRARARDRAFTLTDENEADVREICRRVDGLPLGVELAAARVGTLSPRLLRERLDDRLGLLTGGPRDLPARQQTLRETIRWSVDLLSRRERDVLAKLSALPSGATLAAAEEVCGADLDTVGSLVDHNLVLRVDVAGEVRFGLLETVREYALELLGEGRLAVELAFARHISALVDAADLDGPAQAEWLPWLPRLDAELDNLRVALDAAARADGELELRLVGNLAKYWWLRGSPTEGYERIERALARGGERSPAMARALQRGAGLAWSRGDLERAKTLAHEAVDVAGEVAATWDELSAHTVLGVVANGEGDFATARHHHERSLELSQKLGLEPYVQKLNLGCVAYSSGDVEAAVPLFEDALAYHRRHERVEGIGFAVLNLGLAHYRLGVETARAEFEEARECFERVGFLSHAAHALQGLAAAEAGDGRFEEAARLLGAAHAELDEVGRASDDFDASLPGEVEAAARRALGDACFEAAFEAGRGAGAPDAAGPSRLAGAPS